MNVIAAIVKRAATLSINCEPICPQALATDLIDFDADVHPLNFQALLATSDFDFAQIIFYIIRQMESETMPAPLGYEAARVRDFGDTA